MRPQILFPVFAPITSLKGIGPQQAPLYKRLCGENLVDLLWHLPVGLIDRGYRPQLRAAEENRVATLNLTVLNHSAPSKRSLPYKIQASDGTDDIIITYFNGRSDFLTGLFPIGKIVAVSGLLERFRGAWTLTHPDYVVPLERQDEIPKFEPVYGQTQGLTNKRLRKSIGLALEKAPMLAEWNDPELMRVTGWMPWRESLIAAHNPSDPLDIEGKTEMRRRLAYDELLADQLGLSVIRRHHRLSSGRSLKGTGLLRENLLRHLPFQLTKGQLQAASEISKDMVEPKRMLRLLQGDVGSGKTIVALLSMLQASEAGAQSVLMAPTEILAKQHHATLCKFLRPLGLEPCLLLSKARTSGRKALLSEIREGQQKIIIGTHAVFQEDVIFHDLGLAVVDEQHRFGVSQRLQLADKGQGVDVLVMTATPIPRTLTLTAYGDMDVSRLVDKPAGRQPIDTRLLNMERLQEVIEGLHRQIKKGGQAYWVCPLIEQSEVIDLAAVTERAELLQRCLGHDVVGLIHGKMPAEAKDKAMSAFQQGSLKVLVATTVIEVGVDVPEATVMIVEHAERFGLAQLHQLRGRVGRGTGKSSCLLLYLHPLGAMAKARLSMLRDTEDGFRLAEEDLRLRGQGELLGLRQSGAPLFRLANLALHADLLAMAHDDARLILNRDPELKTERGQALRVLLYLFGRDAAVPLLRAG